MTEVAAMEAESRAEESAAGLYLADCDIIRKLGFGQKFGYKLLQKLDRGVAGMRVYPQKDALFGDKRFWPAVLQWHMDYHRVRRQAEASEATIQPRWQENFDATPSGKARGSRNPRSELAAT